MEPHNVARGHHFGAQPIVSVSQDHSELNSIEYDYLIDCLFLIRCTAVPL